MPCVDPVTLGLDLTLAEYAAIPRSWLYTHPDLRRDIE
jgi:hypothetical protein